MNRISLVYLLLSLCVSGVFAQNSVATRNTASVSGRITIGDKAAQGIDVVIKKRDDREYRSGNMQPPAAATTDADGRYRVTNLAAGKYLISAYAPAYVIAGEKLTSYEYGKTITISDGENVENIDFSLTRGGVITGKVTDEYGKPVIEEGVGAFRLDAQGKIDRFSYTDMLRWTTDDRGVYRIFGLEAGRYIVGAGSSSEEAVMRMGRATYKRSYHPETDDESKATVIEITPGTVVEDADIKLTRNVKGGYKATGRVIDAETGNPIPGMMIGYGITKKSGMSFGSGNSVTNSNGEFRLEGLSPNTYTVYALTIGQSDLYSDSVNFEITNDDVSGLEIKRVRGASISGVAVVDGVRDPAVLAQLSKIPLRAEVISEDWTAVMVMGMTGGGLGNINSNGTFKIGGVRPGRTRIIALNTNENKGFSFVRVEHNGVEVKELSVSQGEQITGVRVVFNYGTGIIMGRVEIKGGELPPNAGIWVSATREGASQEDWWSRKQAPVDARGQFSIEGLSQGSYKVSLQVYQQNSNSQPNFPRVEQSVAISGNARQEITLVLDLTKKGGER